MLSYPIIVSRVAGGALLTSPDFPEVAVDCTNAGNIHALAAEEIQKAIAARMASGHDVPEPSPGAQRAVLPMPTKIKVRLYQAARKQGIDKSELARRLGWRDSEVDQLFSPMEASRLDQLESACQVLGLRLTFDVDVA